MSVFSDIVDQWQIADDAFTALEQAAFTADDDASFDAAGERRKRNDQAYFLYLFTRFEDAVNKAIKVIIDNRVAGATWSERRIWEAWPLREIGNIPFMSKVEVLIDKSLNPYATIKDFYKGRNAVAHGGIWEEQLFIPTVAATMESICNSFPTN
jgi:hypothetical protein